jgi:hypothetical protein
VNRYRRDLAEESDGREPGRRVITARSVAPIAREVGGYLIRKFKATLGS